MWPVCLLDLVMLLKVTGQVGYMDMWQTYDWDDHITVCSELVVLMMTNEFDQIQDLNQEEEHVLD